MNPHLERIFIINLDRRPDRYDVIYRQLQMSDLKNTPTTRFSAYDTSSKDYLNDLSEMARKEMEHLQSSGVRDHHSQLTKGSIGCYKSHLGVWQAILETPGTSDADMFLVLEDDADIPQNALQKIKGGISVLSTSGVRLDSPAHPFIVFWELICLEGCVSGPEPTLFTPKLFWSTQNYSLSKASAKGLLDLSFFPIDVQFDCALQLQQDAGVLQLFAYPIFRNGGKDSDIQVPVVKNAPYRRAVAVAVADTSTSAVAKPTALTALAEVKIETIGGDSDGDDDDDDDGNGGDGDGDGDGGGISNILDIAFITLFLIGGLLIISSILYVRPNSNKSSKRKIK